MSDLFDDPSVDARIQGLQFLAVGTGSQVREYTFPFCCLFNGLTIGSSVTSFGSYVSLETQYSLDGGVTWKRYKKFAKSWNLIPGHVDTTILFPTKPDAGVKLVFNIENNDGAAIDIAVNLFQFTPVQLVDVLSGEQGDDW